MNVLRFLKLMFAQTALEKDILLNGLPGAFVPSLTRFESTGSTSCHVLSFDSLVLTLLSKGVFSGSASRSHR